MANRRCLHTITRHGSAILSSNPSLQSLKTIPYLQALTVSDPLPLQTLTSKFHYILRNLDPICYTQSTHTRHFSSHTRNSDTEDENDDVEVDEGEEMEESSDGEGEDENENDSASNCTVERAYSVEEKENEAAAIGYKVIGPLDPSDRPFKPYEPAFAVVQLGSHQFKVSNRDCIYTERLKFCEVNDKLILNRVLLLGSRNQTIIGRPILPDAAVHAVVEEHALDAKVIIFKKKRRKNYRRTKGHRQELTKLRITDIQGIEKPENTATGKPENTATGKPKKAAVKKQEKVAVAA